MRALFPILLVSTLCSCGKQQYAKQTFPVTGEVYVDGKPADNLAVHCHDVKGMDKQNPTTSTAFTDPQGKFKISTYETGDGVPEGEYKLTFFWGQMNLFSMSYGGPDKLNKRYDDPEKSEHRVTVQNGKPTDLGRIELKSK